MNKFDKVLAIHSGKESPNLNTRPEVMPIYQTSVYAFEDISHVDRVLEQEGGFIYSRYSNPNRDALGKTLAGISEAEAAVTTASGMGAIASAILALVSENSKIVASHEVYGGTFTLLSKDLIELGIEVEFVDMTDIKKVENSLDEKTSIIYLETITNPTMKVADQKKIINLAHKNGIKVIVDNTFASPYVFKPLSYGADVVVHSLTKYINGHSDVTAGVVLGSKEFCETVNEKVKSFGASLGPFDAWLTMRGLKTLELRMERICKNALEVAKYLETKKSVKLVNYPGLKSHPQNIISKDQFKNGFGGMLSFELDGGLGRAEKFIQDLEMIEYVPSLAGVATTLLHPVSTSHRPMPKEKRLALGITDGLIRLSIGIEPVEAIIEDLEKAL
ncbi:MAG: trans-sulfuration enzyme family protein [Clostridia bacterium]